MGVSLPQDRGAAKRTVVEIVLQRGCPHQGAAYEQGPSIIPSFAAVRVAVALAVRGPPAPTRGQQGRGSGRSSSGSSGRHGAPAHGSGGNSTVQHHD